MAVPLIRQLALTGSDPASTSDKRIGAGGGSSSPGGTSRSSRSSSRSRKRPHLIPTVIIDKSPLFRAGLVHLLAGSRFRVTASRSSLHDLSERVFDELRLALISLDGEVAADLSRVAFLAKRGVCVILLSEKFHPEELVAAIEAGAGAYLLKNEIALDVLVKSLELAWLGAVVIPQGFTKLPKDFLQPQPNAVPAAQDPGTVSQGGQAQPACDAAQTDEVERLSNREKMILTQLMQGVSNKYIARELNIAEATVKVHVKSVLRKIRVSNRTQAAMWGRDRVRPNGQPKQPPANSPPGGDSDITSGTKPNGYKADSQIGLRTAAGLGQVLAEIDFKGGFG
jgi:two-component system, NarL family, nitrate/nitrite response regulator NarL